MPTRSDHLTDTHPTTATDTDPTTATGPGASSRRSVQVAVVVTLLALVAIAVWLTVGGPDAGISPAADAEVPSTSDTDDVPNETLVRNRGIFE